MHRVKIPGAIVILVVLAGAFLIRGFVTGAAHASSPVNCVWTLVPTQSLSTVNATNAVTAIDAKDVWAVGGIATNNPTGPFGETLAEQWNGSAWQVVPTPNPGAGYNALAAVARIPGGGLWAVGYLSNTTSGPRTDQTLIERWNGKSWQVVASPNVGTQNNDLYGVVALSATDAWAVGAYTSSAPFNPQEVLIEHWDGTQWSVVQGANPSPSSNILRAIAATSAGDIWAVGSQQPQSGPTMSGTLVEHWDGTQWSAVTSPNPANFSNSLNSVSVVSATSIWAVGSSANSSSPFQTLTEHWDGTQWSVVTSPDPGSAVDALNGVVALGPDSAWAVGYDVGASNLGHTLVLHWDGKAWHVSASPNGGTDYNVLEGVTRVPGASQVWAVGLHFNNSTGTQESFSLFHC